MLTEARVVIAYVLGVLWLVDPAHAQVLTEREAVQLFLTRSAYAQEIRASQTVVEAQTNSWHVWPNPQAGFEHEGAGLTQVTQFQQSLPLNGRLGLLRKAGSAAVLATGTQGEYELWRLCNDMRRSFYDLALAQRRETTLSESLQKLEEVVRILGEREQHGEGSRYDLLRADQEKTNILAEITLTQAVVASTRSQLLSYLPRDADSTFMRVEDDLGISEDFPALAELLRHAIENRQDYRSERHRQEQFEWEKRAASRMHIPNPVVFAGIKRAGDSGSIQYGPQIGVSVSIPLFDRGQYRATELEAELRRSSYRQEVLRGQIEFEVRGAYEDLRMRRQAATEYRQRAEQQGTQLESIATLAYQEGELGILELLDAYRIRRESVLRLQELAAAVKQAEINLERAVGRLVLNPEVLP